VRSLILKVGSNNCFQTPGVKVLGEQVGSPAAIVRFVRRPEREDQDSRSRDPSVDIGIG
jgi:hypothetical protein